MAYMLEGMKPYSIDLRERVMAASDAGRLTKEVARTFQVSPAWVRRLKQHRRERGDIIPRNGGGSRGRKIDRDRLAQLVQEQPDATLAELRDRLVAKGGVKVTPWPRALGSPAAASGGTPPADTLGYTSGWPWVTPLTAFIMPPVGAPVSCGQGQLPKKRKHLLLIKMVLHNAGCDNKCSVFRYGRKCPTQIREWLS
jgi:transposase